MSIFKMNTSWLKAVTGNTLSDAFQDAWSLVVNVLDGAWGNVSHNVISGDSSTNCQFEIIKNNFKTIWRTDVSGSITVTLPFDKIKNDGLIEVNYFDVSGTVTSTDKYVIDSQTKNLTLSSGDKLIIITGTTRRI